MDIYPGDIVHAIVEHAGRRERCFLYFSFHEANTCKFCQEEGYTLVDRSFYEQELRFILTEHRVFQNGKYYEPTSIPEELVITFHGFEYVSYYDGGDVRPSAACVTFRYQSYTVSSLPVDEPLIVERREQ